MSALPEELPELIRTAAFSVFVDSTDPHRVGYMDVVITPTSIRLDSDDAWELTWDELRDILRLFGEADAVEAELQDAREQLAKLQTDIARRRVFRITDTCRGPAPPSTPRQP